MLLGAASLGVCVRAADAGSGAASAVETWPLVQAFALSIFEADGGGSFLTSRVAVKGVGDALCPMVKYIWIFA